jgi:two-component system, NtrC family, response regulator PilR
MASILVVDDERSMREFLEILLAKQGHAVATAEDLSGAVRRLGEGGIDLVITDLRLGRESGLDVLRAAKAAAASTEVVMVTAWATTENAVQAMKLGAYDYLLKPFKLDELKLVVEKALERRALVAENRVLRHQLGARAPRGAPEILGGSPAIEEVRSLIEKVAGAPTTVLLMGESGTGKEVAARAIHAAGPRAGQPFVAVNCGAIPEGLIESELFGHERGSFTGATEAKSGLFEVAATGTLFLDEVSELPLALQVKLLRAVQERRIRRVGGTADLPFAARILAATNRDLPEEVRVGRFREDLFYRLNVIQLRLPPLRDRADDIPVFLAHYLARFAHELGRPVSGFSPDAERLLRAYPYPGNVRELANVVERAVTLADGERIEVAVLPPAVRGAALPAASAAAAELPADGLDLQAHLDRIERSILEQALSRAGGVKTEAARHLSLTFRSLRYRLAKYRIGEP